MRACVKGCYTPDPTLPVPNSAAHCSAEHQNFPVRATHIEQRTLICRAIFLAWAFVIVVSEPRKHGGSRSIRRLRSSVFCSNSSRVSHQLILEDKVGDTLLRKVAGSNHPCIGTRPDLNSLIPFPSSFLSPACTKASLIFPAIPSKLRSHERRRQRHRHNVHHRAH